MQRDRHQNDPQEKQSVVGSSIGTELRGRGDTDKDQSGLSHGRRESVDSTQRKDSPQFTYN